MVTRINRAGGIRWVILQNLLLLGIAASSCSGLSVPPSTCHLRELQVLKANPSSRGVISFGDVLGAQEADDNRQNSNSNEHSLKSWRWQYWCDSCACGFNKLKSYKQHNKGKRHKAILEQADQIWEAYKHSGPTYYDVSITKDIVTRDWSLDSFLEGLQARSRSSIKHTLSSAPSSTALSNTGGAGNQLDPNLRLNDLTSEKRAALWRYLYTSKVPHLAEMVAALPPKYVRLKELLESLEVFANIQRLLSRSTEQGRKPQLITDIYDIGCGHGLVGMLCAATYSKIRVRAIDREPRESFQAQRDAFVAAGVSMDNLQFMAGALSVLEDYNKPELIDDTEQSSCSSTSLLLCVHGCKSLTHESIEWAQLPQNQWAWLVVPCCLQLENHLDSARTSLKVASDDLRFAMLCGALTAKYQPDTVTTMDSRITARGIVMMASSTRQDNEWFALNS